MSDECSGVNCARRTASGTVTFVISPAFVACLYEVAPLAAFVVEFIYGMFCWYIPRGGAGLFALISLGRLANDSFFSPAIAGPEEYLAGRPMLLVTVVLVQIVVTLVLVGTLQTDSLFRGNAGTRESPPDRLGSDPRSAF